MKNFEYNLEINNMSWNECLAMCGLTHILMLTNYFNSQSTQIKGMIAHCLTCISPRCLNISVELLLPSLHSNWVCPCWWKMKHFPFIFTETPCSPAATGCPCSWWRQSQPTSLVAELIKVDKRSWYRLNFWSPHSVSCCGCEPQHDSVLHAREHSVSSVN